MDHDVPTVEYAMTEDDLVAFADVPFTSALLFRYSPGVLRFFAFVATIVVFVLVAAVSGNVERWHNPAFRGTAFAVIAAIFICSFVFERPLSILLLRRRIRAGRYIAQMQQRRLEITAAGLRSTTRTEGTIVPWTQITEVRVSGAGAYLISGKRRGYLVPRRAFASQAAFSDFVRAAQALGDLGSTAGRPKSGARVRNP